jgi:hypothetical protein
MHQRVHSTRDWTQNYSAYAAQRPLPQNLLPYDLSTLDIATDSHLRLFNIDKSDWYRTHYQIIL